MIKKPVSKSKRNIKHKRNKLLILKTSLVIILLTIIVFFFTKPKNDNSPNEIKSEKPKTPFIIKEETQIVTNIIIDSLTLPNGNNYSNKNPEEIFDILSSFITKNITKSKKELFNGISWQNFSLNNLFFGKDLIEEVDWNQSKPNTKLYSDIEPSISKFLSQSGFKLDKTRGCLENTDKTSICNSNLKIFVKNNQYIGLTNDNLSFIGDIPLKEQQLFTASRLYLDDNLLKYQIGWNWDVDRDKNGNQIENLVWSENNNNRYLTGINHGFHQSGSSWLVYYQKNPNNTFKRIFESKRTTFTSSQIFDDSFCMIFKNLNIGEFERNSLVEVLRKNYCCDCNRPKNSSCFLNSASIEELMKCNLSK